jgi:hypothetical protein
VIGDQQQARVLGSKVRRVYDAAHTPFEWVRNRAPADPGKLA